MKSIQHAIITGGSSGIGKALASKLFLEGYNLTLIARDQSKLDQFIEELKSQHLTDSQKILGLSADVSIPHDIDQAIQHSVKGLGNPNLLITSAGVAHPGYFEDLNLDVFEQTMKINYFGTLYAIKAALPYFKNQKNAHVVLISSAAGLLGLFGYSAYSPSKFAVRGLAESLRPEFNKRGINISIVYPPDTDTPQLEYENLIKPIETKKLTGQVKLWSPDAVAENILQGIKKKKFHICPGTSVLFLRIFHSTLFAFLNKYMDKIISSK